MTQNVVPLLNSHQERRKREINERIKDAGIQLFTEQGYEPTTIEQICERANVARRTFYKHFLSKQHLAYALSESWMYEQTARAIENACAHSENAIERVRYYIASSAENLRNYEALERMMIQHAMQDVSFDDRAVYRWTHQSKLLKPLIALGQERGEVTTAHDAEFLGKMVAGGLNTVVVSWIYEEGYPVAEQLHGLADFLTAALKPALSSGNSR
jgi:AcrR family transcriptional regulator